MIYYIIPLKVLLFYYVFHSSVWVKDSDGFLLPPNPIKQLLFSQAMISSLTEKFEFDMIDRTIVIQQFVGNSNYEFLMFYILGIIMVDTRNILLLKKMDQEKNSKYCLETLRESEYKLQNIAFYKKTKIHIKQFMFVVFCIFINNIDSVV